MTKSEAGKLGEKASHKKRYDLLKIVSAKADKKYLNFIMKWPTRQIEVLVASWENK